MTEADFTAMNDKQFEAWLTDHYDRAGKSIGTDSWTEWRAENEAVRPHLATRKAVAERVLRKYEARGV